MVHYRAKIAGLKGRSQLWRSDTKLGKKGEEEEKGKEAKSAELIAAHFVVRNTRVNTHFLCSKAILFENRSAGNP